MTSHAETRKLPYTAAEMYALVADVARYPDFLPWIAAARVRQVTEMPDQGKTVMLADMVISFKVFREKFVSRVTLYPRECRIDTEYIEGPFHHMVANWGFRDLPEGGCEVSFRVDFEFRNRILQSAAGMFFHDAMLRIVRAFERRAAVLHG